MTKRRTYRPHLLRDRRGHGTSSPYVKHRKAPFIYEGTPLNRPDQGIKPTERAIEAFQVRLGVEPWMGAGREPPGYPKQEHAP